MLFPGFRGFVAPKPLAESLSALIFANKSWRFTSPVLASDSLLFAFTVPSLSVWPDYLIPPNHADKEVVGDLGRIGAKVLQEGGTVAINCQSGR